VAIAVPIYFSFSIPSASLVTLNLTVDNTVTTGVPVQVDINDFGNTFYGTTGRMDGGFISVILPVGTYYLYIPATSEPRNFNYTITIDYQPCSNNPSYASIGTTATAAKIGVGTISDVEFCPGEPSVKYFEFRPSDSGQLSVFLTVSQSKGLAAFDYSVQNASGSPLCTQIISSSVSPVACYTSVTANTTYYIRVSPSVGGNNPQYGIFSMSVVLEVCVQDSNEPNNGPDTATPVTSGSSYFGSTCGGDHDFYKVSPVATGTLTVRSLVLSPVNATINVCLRVYIARTEMKKNCVDNSVNDVSQAIQAADEVIVEYSTIPFAGNYMISFTIDVPAAPNPTVANSSAKSTGFIVASLVALMLLQL